MVKILFICDRNTVRSPMAAAMLKDAESAGIAADDMVDPFACAAMFEEGLDITGHTPRTVDFRTLDGRHTVIALSLPAFEAAQKFRAKGRNQAAFGLEYWSLPDVPSHNAARDTILDGYRAIVRALKAHMDNRFGKGV